MEKNIKFISFILMFGCSIQISAQSYKLIKGNKVERLDSNNQWVEVIPMAGESSVLNKDAYVKTLQDFEVRDQKTGAKKKCGPAPNGERLMTLIARGYKSKIIPGTASTQARGTTKLTPIIQDAETPTFPIFHYLLVDINHFEDHHWDSLKVPHADIDTLDMVLQKEMVPSNNYILRNRAILNSPKSTISDSIRYHLDKLASVVRRNGNDIVMLYIASHGESTKDGEYNIIASDTKYDSATKNITNALTAQEFNKFVRRMTDKGARVMVFVDACHAGALINALDGNSIAGSVYFMSTGSKNNAYAFDGKSRFAEALINAVSGREWYYFDDNKVFPANLDKYIRIYAEHDSLAQYPQMMDNILGSNDLLWIIKPKGELFDLEQKVKEGDVDAMIKLGDMYYYGSDKFNLPSNDRRAYDLFEQAYESNKSPKAAAKLGMLCFYGSDMMLQDYEKAFRYFQESAAESDNLGRYYMSVCYAKGIGTAKDVKKSKEIYASISLFDKDVINGFAREGVTYKLERMNLDEKFKTKYVTKIVRGYSDGRGHTWFPKEKEKKKKKQLYWFVNNAGVVGVKDNNKHTQYWEDPFIGWNKQIITDLKNRINSEQSSEAMVELGEIYLKDNPNEAAKLFTKAANLGNSIGVYWLGFCYEMGYGVERNFAKAEECYVRANKKGELAATYRLGCLYYEGDDYLPQDYAVAANYWQQSAKKKVAISQYNYGVCCVNGIGVNKNEKEGLKWIKKAAKYGNKEAIEYLKKKSSRK